MFDSSVMAQQVHHQSPAVVERGKNITLSARFPEISRENILEAVYLIKNSNSFGFDQYEADVNQQDIGVTFRVDDATVSSFEYYIIVRLTDGRQIVYPDINSDNPPLYVEVKDPPEPEFEQADFIDIAILSPQPNSTVTDDDFLLAAALFYDESDTKEGEFILLINGEDVSESAEISQFMIKYRGDDRQSGSKRVQILFKNSDNTLLVEEWSYRVAGSVSPSDPFGVASRALPGGDIELGGRSQSISGRNNSALTGRMQVGGKEGKLRYRARGFLTSQEDNRLQPQNRLQLNLNYGNSAYLHLGDTNPFLSNLTIRGRRVRGLHTGFSLFNEVLNADFIYGQMNRSISNLYNPIKVNEGDDLESSQFTLNLKNAGRGTFKRIVKGGKLAIGRDDGTQFGLSLLKIEDDTTSITSLNNFSDVIDNQEALSSTLSQQQQQFLEQNPEQLETTNAIPKPQGNIVLGSEFRFRADSDRIRFQTEMGASLLNQDILRGPLDSERADDLGFNLSESDENTLSDLAWLIIINDNMSTVPYRFNENEDGELDLDLFFPTSILANETQLNLGYFNHQLQLQYRWIGPDYQSLANSTIRRDVAGFSLLDRFRLFKNRLFFTVGYENLRDNVNNFKEATIRTKTSRLNVGWYPFNEKLPRVNAGFRYRTRGNDVERFNPFLNPQQEFRAVRNFDIVENDSISTSTPRDNQTLTFSMSVIQSFDWLRARHQAAVSFTNVNTESFVFNFGDSKSRSFSLSVTSRFEGRPFRTRLNWNSNNTESLSGLNDVKINAFDLGFDYYLLDNRLTVGSDISFAFSNFETTRLIVNQGDSDQTITDDFFEPSDEAPGIRKTRSFILRTSAEYLISNQHVLQLFANYSNVANRLDGFASIPNDRIIDLRYLFRF